MRLLTLVGAFALMSAACGGPEAKSPKALAVTNPFPTKGALEKLAQTTPKPLPAREVASVPEWRVDVRDLPETSPVDRFFAGDVRLTRELRCVARELARVRAEHGSQPDERVQRFINGACGLASPFGVSSYQWTADVPPEATDDQLLDSWKNKVTVPPAFKGKAAGVWLARKGTKAVVMMVARDGTDAPVALSAGDAPGKVSVRGTAGADVDYVLALVNHGKGSVARCEPDRGVELPHYSFTCTLADGDPWTWIEVATRTSGRLLMRTAALLLARRDENVAVELTPGSARSQTGAASTRDEIVRAVLEGVNRARQSGNAGPLTLAPKQTVVNERLAPHFFNAEAAADAKTGDLVALGLIAGWDVEGTIKNGDLFGTMLSGAKDASSWLDYALEHPMARFVLLRPEARQVAIGATSAEGGGLGVVATTYSFFGAENHQASSTRVFERLAQERAARRLPPITALPDMPSLVDQARLVHAGQREPMAALDNALGTEAQRLGQPMRGWVLVTNDLDILPFPKELLAPGPLAVRVVVTHYRPEDAAWGAYLVYIVAPAPAQQQVASKPALMGARSPAARPQL
jgi:hypothetical protein